MNSAVHSGPGSIAMTTRWWVSQDGLRILASVMLGGIPEGHTA